MRENGAKRRAGERGQEGAALPRRLVRPRTAALGALWAGISACIVDLAVPLTTEISCATDADCPAAHTCHDERCLRGAVSCSDGRFCPEGTACDDLHALCVLPDQLSACGGASDGAPCSVVGQPPGICRDDVCLPEACGDHLISGAEECEGVDLGGVSCADLGYYNEPGLACTPDCRFDTVDCTGFCSDGIVSAAHELCDGAPPAASCSTLGFGYGAVGCSGFCGPDFGGCRDFGWTAVPPPSAETFTAVWGAAADDLFLATLGGGVWRFNGVAWTATDTGAPAGSLNALWGTASTDVFAAGDAGTILHYDGEEWTAMVSGTSERLAALWGSGPQDVYAAGESGTVAHYTDSGWSVVRSGGAEAFTSVWGSGPVLFVAGGSVANGGSIWRYDGTWAPMSLPPGSETIEDLWGSGPEDVYAVVASGTVLRYSGGTSFLEYPIPSGTWVSRIWGSGPNDVLATGGMTLYSDGTGFQDVGPLPGSIWDLWGSGPGDVYAVGYGGTVLHYRGSFAVSSDIGRTYYSVAGTAADDVFAVGSDDLVSHWDGGQWSTTSTGVGGLLSVWAVAPLDVYAAGEYGAVAHYDGSWSPMTSNTAGWLFGLWASDAEHVYAAGAYPPSIVWCDGATWFPVDPAPANDLFAVWGTAFDDVFAVGAGGSIVHFGGGAWLPMDSGTDVDLWAVGGNGPNDVYAVGDVGTILHYDGDHWSPVASPVQHTFSTVWGGGVGREVFIGAWASPGLLHGDAAGFLPVDVDPLPYVNDLWGTGPSLFVVGGADRAIEILRTGVRCGGSEPTCDDYWDNDCDGLTDACDPDCAGKEPSEQCANARDDDCDGAIDCDDASCAVFPGCD